MKRPTLGLAYSISKPVEDIVTASFNFSLSSSFVSNRGRSIRLKQVLKRKRKIELQAKNNPGDISVLTELVDTDTHQSATHGW